MEQIRQARENLRRHGIRACYFLQFGYPGREWEDIEKTIRLVRETRPDDIGVSVSYPLPSTRFHRMVSNASSCPKKLVRQRRSGEDVSRQLPTEFYRALADALHSEVAQSVNK